jgi:AcrR family transcriptional regulator
MGDTAGGRQTSERGKRDAIMNAALARFSHYGFRRTSMEDIAQQAGISRAALYLHFRNKEEIFRALARQLHEQAIAAAEKVATEGRDAAEQIGAALGAKLGGFFEIVHASAHARELIDENSRLCGDISADFRARHARLLRRLIEEGTKRGELAPERAGMTPAAAAELLLDCAKGIEKSGGASLTPADYHRRLAELVHVVARGLGRAVPAARAPQRHKHGGGAGSARPRR